MDDSSLQFTATAAATPTDAAHTGGVSRLRSGGLLRAAAGLAACAAVSAAQASIVYSGEVNVAFQRLGSIVNVDLAPGATLGLRGSYFGKDSGYAELYVSEAAGFSAVGTAADSQVAQRLDSGFSVDASSAFSQGDTPLRTTDSPGLGDFFVGFNFDPAGNGPNYGWLHINRISGSTWSLIDYAYENTGQAILTGDNGLSPGAGPDPNAVPEPATLPLVLAAGGVLGLIRRLRCAAPQPSDHRLHPAV